MNLKRNETESTERLNCEQKTASIDQSAYRMHHAMQLTNSCTTRYLRYATSQWEASTTPKNVTKAEKRHKTG